MVIAFSGTRNTPPIGSPKLIQNILMSSPTGTRFLVGCCPSGVDRLVREQWHRWAVALLNAKKSLVVITAESQQATALRARTIAMVSSCEMLLVIPCSTATWQNGKGSGSWLAAFQGAAARKLTRVYLPEVTSTALPCCHGIISWYRTPEISPALQTPGRFFHAPRLQPSFL